MIVMLNDDNKNILHWWFEEIMFFLCSFRFYVIV